jgi:hypothetical protein
LALALVSLSPKDHRRRNVVLSVSEIIMAVKIAGAAYEAKCAEFARDIDRAQEVWEAGASLDEAVDVFQVCHSWMQFWAEWGHPEQREFCRRQLAARQAELERVQALARKLIARDYPWVLKQ